MSKPNVLWFYCDELRTDALGCYGNFYARMKTPNIDRIAERGALFRNHFCNSPVCVSSRTATITGLYPEDTGVYNNEANWKHYALDREVETIPQVFERAGYRTVSFGKMHLARGLRPFQEENREGGPMHIFFEGVDRDALGIIQSGRIPTDIGGHYPGDRPYPAQPVFDNALAWLEKRSAEGPFFMRLSILQPHTPVFPPPPYDTLYADAPFPDAIREAGSPSAFETDLARVIDAQGTLSPREIYLAQVYYYGLVAWVDAQVGRVLDGLRRLGLEENTIVVFDADHGASLGENGLYAKHVFAPQVHRTPFIVSWPGEMQGPMLRGGLAQGIDLGRTLFALAGIEAPAQFKGRNLFGDPEPEAIFSTIGYGFTDSRPLPNLGDNAPTNHPHWPRRSCIRTRQFRLDKNVRRDGQPVSDDDADVFLADRREDPAEVVNRAGQKVMGEVRRRLESMLDAHTANAVEVPEEYTRRP